MENQSWCPRKSEISDFAGILISGTLSIKWIDNVAPGMAFYFPVVLLLLFFIHLLFFQSFYLLIAGIKSIKWQGILVVVLIALCLGLQLTSGKAINQFGTHVLVWTSYFPYMEECSNHKQGELAKYLGHNKISIARPVVERYVFEITSCDWTEFQPKSSTG